MEVRRGGLSLVLSIVVGCGGTAPSTSASGTATSSAAAASPTLAATATPAATGPRLSDLLAAAKVGEYKVTYKISATGEGAEAFAGEQTWYSKPPKSRFDFTTTFGGTKTTTSVFSLPDGSFYCLTAGGSMQCFRVGVGTGSPLDANVVVSVQQQILAQPDRYSSTFTETRSIAGQQGHCYALTGGVGTIRSGTFCYTKDGLMLLSQYGAASATGASAVVSVEATNVSTTVPDSDFVLPAAPVGR